MVNEVIIALISSNIHNSKNNRPNYAKLPPNVVIIWLKVMLEIYEIILITLSIVFIYGLLKYIFVSTYFEKIKCHYYYLVWKKLIIWSILFQIMVWFVVTLVLIGAIIYLKKSCVSSTVLYRAGWTPRIYIFIKKIPEFFLFSIVVISSSIIQKDNRIVVIISLKVMSFYYKICLIIFVIAVVYSLFRVLCSSVSYLLIQYQNLYLL